MANTAKRVIAYVADIKDVISKSRRIQEINRSIISNLGTKYAHITNLVSGSYTDVKTSMDNAGTLAEKFGGHMVKTSQLVKDANGKMYQFSETTKKLADGTMKTSTSLKSMDKNAVSLGQNISRLAKRALLTIPIWMGLRTAITGTFRTLRDGLKTIAEQDRAFQKAKVNLQATAKDQAQLNKQFAELQKRTLELSLATGKSVVDITNAFQRFATVGFDFEVAMTGASEATKLAVARFGKTEENANALARAFRLLSNNSKDNISTSEQLSKTVALIAELWKDQAFEVDELAGALERFAPVANIANFSMEETIKILSALQTAGIRSTRAGRLLSTSVLQLNKNFDKLNKILGLNINPEMYTTFELFQLVLKEINKLQKVSSFKATEALNELFRVRSTQVVAGLATSLDNFIDVLGRTGDINKFNNEVDEMTNQTFVLAERFTNVNKEIGKFFVQGLVGGDDFNESLGEIVKTLEQIRKNAEKAGIAVQYLITGLGTFGIGVPLLEIANASRQASNKLSELNVQIQKGLKGDLKTDELLELFNVIRKPVKFEGFKDVIIPERTVKAIAKVLEYQQQVELSTGKQYKTEKEIAEEKKKQAEIDAKTEATIVNKILSHRLEELKILGYQTSEILKAKGLLQNQLGITEKYEDTLARQLQIEREINSEKRLQSKLGTESMKLFEIAQKEGIDVAKKIGDVLAGEIDFDIFVRQGGQALEVFKNKFSDIFKQQQALAFFKGETVPGLKGLRGGTEIKIEEEGLRKLISSFDVKTELRKQRAIDEQKRTISPLTAQKIQELQVANMNVSQSNFKQNPTTIKSANGTLSDKDIAYLLALNKQRVEATQKGEVNINFNRGAIEVNGSANDNTIKLMKEAITKAVKEVKDNLYGKQSPTY